MRRAFTLIELIFVVVIVGIMALAARSYFIQDDSLYRAARQTLEHIRYAQHLAINQDKFDPKDKMYHNVSGYSSQNLGTYFRGWWQIRFVSSSSLVGYSVYSDYDRQGGIDYSTNNGNNAINPATNIRDGKFLYADPQRRSASSPDVLLDTKYQISNIQFSSNCTAPANDFEQIGNDVGAIAFDEKGRPYYGIAQNSSNNPYQFKLTGDCTITLTNQAGKQAVLVVHPETGYAEILSVGQ